MDNDDEEENDEDDGYDDVRTLMTMMMQVRLASPRFYSTTDESSCPIMDILLHTA